MSETKNSGLGLYGVEHLKCNRMMTLGFKGLNRLHFHRTRCLWLSTPAT